MLRLPRDLQDTTLIRVSHMSDEKVARQKTHSR